MKVFWIFCRFSLKSIHWTLGLQHPLITQIPFLLTLNTNQTKPLLKCIGSMTFFWNSVGPSSAHSGAIGIAKVSYFTWNYWNLLEFWISTSISSNSSAMFSHLLLHTCRGAAGARRFEATCPWCRAAVRWWAWGISSATKKWCFWWCFLVHQKHGNIVKHMFTYILDMQWYTHIYTKLIIYIQL